MRTFGSPYLTEITLPASLTYIPTEAFADCVNLKTVTFDPNWGAAPLAVGMFQNCPALEEITLPADLAAVPEYCFYMCTSLKTVHFPQGLKSIGRKAFASCWSLQEIDLPASLELFDSSHYSLGQYYSGYACEAFAGCALTEVDLTGCPLLTEIPAGTFAANGELTVIRLGDSIRTIGDRAFSRSGMTQDYLSGDREVLYGKYTPYQYLPVAELRWPSGLTAIGDEAFLDCFLGKLSDEPFPLQLPETVKTIGSWAFAAGDHPQMFATRMYNMIVLPEGRLPSGITLLGESTFRHTAVTEIAVPEGVISIGGYCFADTPRLKAVTLPDSVTEIGDWAFSSCGITAPGNRYTLPAGLKTVGFAAFVDTPGVKHWVLPAGLELLERRAFDFGTDEDPHTLTFLNQDGGLPVIRMDDDLFSGPVTIRCYEHSAAHTWALERQAGANGENVRIVLVDDSAILRVLLLKEDGSAVGERELLSVAWYDETAGSGVLSWETSLEEDIDPTHVYRVDMITADDLRYNYLVPETLSLSVYPQNEPSVTYTLKPRERVTYSFGVADYDNHAAAHLVTVSTSVGGITRLYSRADKNLPYDYDARRFLLELPRIETAVAVSMPGCSLLTLKHIQLLEAEDGVIDLGVLEPVYNPLALEYPLRFVDAATGKAVQPGFGRGRGHSGCPQPDPAGKRAGYREGGG